MIWGAVTAEMVVDLQSNENDEGSKNAKYRKKTSHALQSRNILLES